MHKHDTWKQKFVKTIIIIIYSPFYPTSEYGPLSSVYVE